MTTSTEGEYVHVQRADIIYSSEGTRSHDRDEALYLLGTIAIALAVFAVAYAAQ